MSKEAEEYRHRKQYANALNNRAAVSDGEGVEIIEKGLKLYAERYYKHKVRKQLEEWDEEKIIEWQYKRRKGTPSYNSELEDFRDELLKTKE